MTRDDIIRMAREAGFTGFDSQSERLQDFAALVAAAELRRLNAELERKSDSIQRLWKERDELRALNAELVKTLKWLDNWLGEKPMPECVDRIRAALAKVEET